MDAKNELSVSRSIDQRNLTKAANTLLGVCSGIIADGVINDTEITYLRTWLAENKPVRSIWPGDVIGKRVEAILADGIVTEDERGDLLVCLETLTGCHFSSTGASSAEGPAIPFDDDPYITFQHKTFCFTGIFYFGTRAACERAVLKLEAMPVDRVSRTLDYLVVGSTVSPDWASTTYGRKIETAIKRQEDYGNPTIITEEQWVDAIKTCLYE